jgi:Short C-terminal domain
MKSSQLERLRQLGELREKGLLTDEEFNQEKGAVMRGSGTSSAGRRSKAQWVERVVLLVTLVAAGAALYFAFDARNDADKSSDEARALRARVAAFKPTLVLQSVDSRTTRIPSDGFRHNVAARCPLGSTAVGGGWAQFPGGSSSPEIIASFSEGPEWLIGAASPSGSSRLDAITVCLGGSGGLKVLSRF